MRKIIIFSALFIALASCNSNGSSETTTDTTTQAGMNSPSDLDTTQPGDGTLNSNVISTDTAAMNVQNSINKAKETKKDK